MSFSSETVVIYIKPDTFCTWSHLFPFKRFYMSTTNESWCGCIQPEHFHTRGWDKNTIKRVKQDQNPTAEMDDQPNVDIVTEIDNKRGFCSPSGIRNNDFALFIYLFFKLGWFVSATLCLNAVVDCCLHLVLVFPGSYVHAAKHHNVGSRGAHLFLVFFFLFVTLESRHLQYLLDVP